MLYVVASGATGFDASGGFVANGYAEHSPGGYSMTAALVIEVVLTAGFLNVILGATDGRALDQVWLFWVAPLIGAVIGALIYKVMAVKEAK